MKQKKQPTFADVRRALKLIPKDSRPATVCAMVGHSAIISMCFGYVHCARCEAQIGDRLAGSFDAMNSVVVAHNCKTCRANFKKLDWRSKFMTPNPFKKPKAVTA